MMLHSSKTIPQSLRLFVIGVASALVFSTTSCQSNFASSKNTSSTVDGRVRPELSTASLASWRDHILAPASELAWEEIPWHSSFLNGLRDAADQSKPMLLWVMNGHPLGCT